MIYLGINGTEFVVNKDDTRKFLSLLAEQSDGKYSPHDVVDYKGFNCLVICSYLETVKLTLITNNPDEYIPIVV